MRSDSTMRRDEGADGVLERALGVLPPNHDFPMVLIDRNVPGGTLDCVSLDNEVMAGVLVDHLAANGHRRIAGLFVGVLHLDSRFNTNIELGIYRRYELVCFLRGDLCDATIRQNGFGNSEAKCHDSYLLSQGTPPVKKGLISGYLHYIILAYKTK